MRQFSQLCNMNQNKIQLVLMIIPCYLKESINQRMGTQNEYTKTQNWKTTISKHTTHDGDITLILMNSVLDQDN